MELASVSSASALCQGRARSKGRPRRSRKMEFTCIAAQKTSMMMNADADPASHKVL